MTETPNIRLTEIAADRKNWSEDMNNNLVLIDAVIGAYFSVQNLQGIWQNSTMYTVDQTVVDQTSSVVYKVLVTHTSANVPTTFAQDRAAHPSYWGVFSSPARSRGAWTPNTSYALNDFIVSGSQYCICIQTHTSTGSFTNDLASGFWSVLVDLSAVGSTVLPVPGGGADGNKVVVTNSSGTGYTIIATSTLLTMLGGTTIGNAVFTATTQGAAQLAIGAQPAGSYQAAAAALTTLAGTSPGAEGVTLINMGALADLKTHIGLGTAAYLNVGTGASNVVRLDGSAKLPAIDGSQLTNLPAAATGFTTGDVKFTFKTVVDSGWIMVDDGTIGSATSGASNRADADTASLYALFWNNCVDADAPVTGGRGANASADFAANKKIGLPKSLGRAVGFAGAGSGLTVRALGHVVGEETHALTSNEQADMGVTGTALVPSTDGQVGPSPTLALNNNSVGTVGASLSGTASGGGATGNAHNNMQPTTFLNGMIKL